MRTEVTLINPSIKINSFFLMQQVLRRPFNRCFPSDAAIFVGDLQPHSSMHFNALPFIL
jgi:hypothetical protein